MNMEKKMQWKLQDGAKDGIDVYYIGTLEAEGVTTVKVANDEEGHEKMEELLASQKIDGAVTMHFPFPDRCVNGWTCSDTRKRKRDVYCQYDRNIQYRSY